jgi:uncharacterized membrane protein HdeD (DUF308 family)
VPGPNDLALTRRRTPWNTVLGLVLVVIGLAILANAVVATRVSVQFLGWMLVLAGVAGLVAALLGLRSGGVAANAVGSAVLLVLGLMCLRNVEAAAVTLTLVAGSLFLLTGLVRVVAAVAGDGHRLGLLIGGGVGIVLGLVVLLNLFTASYALLGVLIGIQTVGEGLTMILVGGLTMATLETEQVAPSS